VLYWSELFWPYIGGIEIFSADLLPALQEYGHEIVVVTSHDNLNLPDRAHHQRVPIHRFPFRSALTSGDVELLVRTRHQVAELKSDFKPNLVHMDGVGPSSLFHLDTTNAHPTPTLVTMHTEVISGTGAGANTLTRSMLRKADWISCVSEAIRTQVQLRVPETDSRLSVVYCGLESPAIAPEPPPREAPCVLCLGRLIALKGFDLALEAFASIAEHFPHARMIIAGDGAERHHLESLATKLGIRRSVEFPGWIEPVKVPALLNTATMVLMPSRREGLPLVGVQAALMARPIVATPVGGLPEIVVHGQTGLLVQKEDSRALAEAITLLLEHPEMVRQMGRAARLRAEKVFGWQRCVTDYNTLYETVGKG
jgi:glycogen(starch) synthase